MSLWAFAKDVYARPGVEAALLELQDQHGQSIPLLLWAAWARIHDPEALAAAARLARQWNATAIVPLRLVRRGLGETDLGPEDARLDLRGSVKAAELESEHLLLQALQEMTPTRQIGDLEAALRAASEVWDAAFPADALARLAVLMTPPLSEEAVGLRGPETLSEEDELALRSQLTALKIEHQDLDDSINALQARPAADQLQIARLKKRKLYLRDQIIKIEDRLTPDIIA